MIFWTIYIVSTLTAVPVLLGIPLRTSDLDQNGHLVHYHRDTLSGGHRRHIHYRPAFKRTGRYQETSRNTFFKNHGTPVNPAAIYEVPSNRHYNVANRVAIELRSLVDRTNSENNNTTDMKSDTSDNSDNSNTNNNNGKSDNNNGKNDNGKSDNNNGKNDNNNGKYETNNGKHESNNGKYVIHHEHSAHRLQNRDAPTPPSENLPTGNVHFPIEALPHGLQFLNRQSQERQIQNQVSASPEQTNGMPLDLNSLLGDLLIETTTSPSITPSDSFLSNSPSLDISFLLGDLAGASNDPGQNLGHHGHEHSHQAHSHGPQGHDHGHQSLEHGTHSQSHSHQGHDNGHGHQAHSQSHDHGHGAHVHDMNAITNNGPNKNSIHDKVIDSKASGRLENLFNGKLNQHSLHSSHAPHRHGDHFNHEVNTLPSTNTVAAGSNYQKSTMHNRPITKRGVSDGDSVSRFPKTFIDNILNIRIGSTTPTPVSVQTTQQTNYNGYITTPRSVETQLERLSGTDLKSVRQANRGLIRKDSSSSNIYSPQETTTQAIVTPSQKELVHLQGIHIMFSDGKQDNTGTIPTVHLTASLSDNVNHLLKMASGGSKVAPELPNATSITDKITGTAVIRDGHLYLVVYPFGNNKSLELHYNQTTKRMPMPRNKPISFSGVHKPNLQTKASSNFTAPIKPTVSSKIVSSSHPRGHQTTVKPTSKTKESSTSHAHLHHASTGSDIHSMSHAHGHMSKPDVSTHADMRKPSHTHGHHQHHQHHQHNMHGHGSPTPSLTGLKLAEVNDTTLQSLLAPIDRFVSPWDSLDFSKVFPYSAGNSSNNTSSKKTLEEDSEVDVVTFVAKATDPFNRMKGIIESLANETFSSDKMSPGIKTGAKKEARFNFELKLQTSNSQNTKASSQSTTNPNNSEEMAIDTNIKSTTANTKVFGVTESAHATTAKPFGENTQDSFGRSSAEITTPSKSRPEVLNGGRNLQTTSDINPQDVMIKSTSDMPYINRNSPAVTPTSRQTPNMGSKIDSVLHVSENIAPSTPRMNKGPSDFYGTTVSYVPNYTKSKFVRQPTYKITTPLSQQIFPDNRKTIARNMQANQRLNTMLGSNLQPFVQRTSPNRFRQGLDRGQSEQIISLADILNDIRRIQLHNMQRFNIQNNNFDTMILSEAQQKPVVRTPLVMEGPVIRETSKRRFSDFPAFRNNRQRVHQPNYITPTPTPVQRRFGRQASDDSGMEAMLVLSVDDIMADQTELHGAIVVSHRRDQIASNKV